MLCELVDDIVTHSRMLRSTMGLQLKEIVDDSPGVDDSKITELSYYKNADFRQWKGQILKPTWEFLVDRFSQPCGHYVIHASITA